jgi:hypothetical protein
MRSGPYPSSIVIGTLAERMRRLRNSSLRDTPKGQRDLASWLAYEKQALDLIPGADVEILMYDALYTCGSAKIIEALPRLPSRTRSFDDVLPVKAAKALTLEAYALAIDKNLLPPLYCEAFIKHRPFDPEWTDFLVKNVASRFVMKYQRHQDLWSEKPLRSMPDPSRLEILLRTQAQHFPQYINRLLTFGLILDTDKPSFLAALYLAGARTEMPRKDVSNPEAIELYDLMTSGSAHDQMTIIDRYGDLSSILGRIASKPRKSK